MQTRRKFLRDCSLVAATAALAPAALGQSRVLHTMAPAWPGFARFRQQVNTAFAVQAGSQTVSLVLAKASALPAPPTGSEIAGNECFSLLFRGPARSPLPQDTYQFDHPQLGTQAIFIVPVGLAGVTHCHYEAVFNRPMHAADLAGLIACAPKRVQKILNS